MEAIGNEALPENDLRNEVCHELPNLNDIYPVLHGIYYDRSGEYMNLRRGVEDLRQDLLLPTDPYDAEKLRAQVDYFPTPRYVSKVLAQVLDEYDD